MARDPLAPYDVALVRADNPSALTLSGTNTWLVGRDPCWVVDPGPDLHEHVGAVLAEGVVRGGIGGVALTHRHADHAGAVEALVAGAGDAVEVVIGAADGARVGPLEAIAVPGHAPDHVCFALGDAGGVCFTGDAVLGEGSVFIAPDPGAMASYLRGLERLRARRFALLAPGHGPVVGDPEAKLEEYIAHRLDRERRLAAALDAGARSIDELLDAAWDDVPDALRLPATVTLYAHLDKLAEEGRVPARVEERPEWFAQIGRHAH
ncbi:Hydroxyacylglutathione hydrolase [Baekduia alba]|uniref:MBL fold metallo-hydrolase n=1 Tax=Baekduia alba TaxID=2997333 RepID=UPI002340527C|nr:MBL fold metallo-hydrolase [Baekduia alba]WCB96051.1 Hydroxyacylglutathione hydrolase [Baekduia alba]